MSPDSRLVAAVTLRYTEKSLLWSNPKGHLLQKGNTDPSATFQDGIFALTFLFGCSGKVISVPQVCEKTSSLWKVFKSPEDRFIET